jgi:hypothetical protein
LHACLPACLPTAATAANDAAYRKDFYNALLLHLPACLMLLLPLLPMQLLLLTAKSSSTC